MRLAVVVSWLVALLSVVAVCTNATPSEVNSTRTRHSAVYRRVASKVGGEPRREEGMS